MRQLATDTRNNKLQKKTTRPGKGLPIKLGKDGTFLGTFIAPNAHIDQHEGATLTGALYGRKAQIKLNAIVTADPALSLFIDLFVP